MWALIRRDDVRPLSRGAELGTGTGTSTQTASVGARKRASDSPARPGSPSFSLFSLCSHRLPLPRPPSPWRGIRGREALREAAVRLAAPAHQSGRTVPCWWRSWRQRKGWDRRGDEIRAALGCQGGGDPVTEGPEA